MDKQADVYTLIGKRRANTPRTGLFIHSAIALAHRILNRLNEARQQQEVNWLRPDSKSQVTVKYENGRPTELDALSGTVLRLGKQIVVPTPVHTFLYSVLLPHKDGIPVAY